MFVLSMKNCKSYNDMSNYNYVMYYNCALLVYVHTCVDMQASNSKHIHMHMYMYMGIVHVHVAGHYCHVN